MSNLEAAANGEHQMMEEDGAAVEAGQGLVAAGTAAALELNQAMTSTDQTQCNLGESTLQSTTGVCIS